MDKLGELLGQFYLAQDLPISASDSVLGLERNWIGTFQILVPPPLVPSKMFLSSVVPEYLHCPFTSNGEILLTNVTPDHEGVVDGIRWPRDKRPGPTDFCEELLSHWDSTLR